MEKKFHYRVHKTHYLVSVMGEINLPLYFFDNSFNIILSFTSTTASSKTSYSPSPMRAAFSSNIFFHSQ